MKLSDRTDLEVFQALQRGDSQALGIFYDRYGEAVYRLLLRLLGNAQEAEDLTQEIFLRLWQKANFDPQRGSLLALLMTMARSRAIDRLRQVKSQERLQQRWGRNLATDNSRTPMDKASVREISQRVRSALQQLPEPQRQALEMAYYDGLSQSEITEHLQIPLGTVKTRSRQGLLKLRQLLKDLVE
jgi:RNA polymerase sigma-70 factor (ECF subfamily)